MKNRTRMKKVMSFILVATMAMSMDVLNVQAKVNNAEFLNLPPDIKENTTISLQSIDSVRLASSEIVVEHDHTIDDIVDVVREYPNDALSDTMSPTFETAPSYTAPYSAGALSDDDLQDAMNAVRVLRYLAGLPYTNVVLDSYETYTAQHKAVLMAVTEYSHHPEQPSDMSDEFYETASDYSAECIAGASWKASMASRVLSWVTDNGDNNIARAGHRMILFEPGATYFGLGYAYSSGAEYPHLYAAHVGSLGQTIDSYIAWPNAGDFPIQYFTEDIDAQTLKQPWSLTLGAAYKRPDRDDITLILTRKRDNKSWIFDKDTPQQSESNYSSSLMHLSVDGDNILFRPDVTSLKSIEDGDVFNVTLTGIEYADGTEATLSYDINFFDLDDALTKSTVVINATHNGVVVSGATVTIGGQTLITDSNGNASTRLKNNKSYTYTVAKNGYTTETGSITVGESSVSQSVSLTMPVTFSISNTSQTYNGSAQGVTVSASPNVTYKVTYDGSETIPTNVGTYSVEVAAIADGYSGSATAKLVISKALLSITADDISKKIGNADPDLTYTITSGQLYGSDAITGTLTRKSGETIGTYNITQGTLTAGDNYSVSFAPGTFTILEKTPQNISVSEITDKTYGDGSFIVTATPDSESKLSDFTYESSNPYVAEIAGDGTVSIKNAGSTNITVKQAGDDDYAAFEKTQTLNVAKVPLTITADSIYKKVDTDDPTLTYTYTGSLVGSDIFSGELIRQSGESIGTYDILQGTLTVNDNYDITYNKGLFEIVEKTPQNITVSSISEVTYGDDDFKVEVTPDSDSNLDTFTYESDNTDVAEISTDGTVTIKGAGEANITVSQVGDEEYAAYSNTQKLTVNQKAIEITSIDLDEKTVVFTGLLDDDETVTVDFTALSITDVAAVDDENSSVTVSAFTLTGDGASNYTVSNESLTANIKTENIVTVTTVATNGTATGAGQYIKGSNVTVTATANSGYSFSKWSDGTTKLTTNASYTFTADEDIELTATFTKKSSSSGGGGGGSSSGSSSTSYTIKFETNGGSSIANKTVTKNGTLTKPDDPTKENYEFAGWYSDEDLTEEYDFSATVSKSMTLYAKWNEINPDANKIILTIGKKDAKVFGQTKSNDVAPKIVNDRTMLPARFVAENLGAKVEWFEDEQKVRITKDEIEILIFIDSDIAYVNDEKVILDSPAFVENDRTYTPIRFISEELGATVEWDEDTQEVTITL